MARPPSPKRGSGNGPPIVPPKMFFIKDGRWAFGDAGQSVAVGQRIEPFGQITFAQCAVKLVCAGFGDGIEDAAARAPKFRAEDAGLHGDFADIRELADFP
jgi:hypothetical protein